MSALQQTRDEDLDADSLSTESAPNGSERTVLEDVIERATSRHEVEKEIQGGQPGRAVSSRTLLTAVSSLGERRRCLGCVCSYQGGEKSQA